MSAPPTATFARDPARGAGEPRRAEPAVEEATEALTALGRPWNVIVWDDPVNLMDYVVYVFQKLFGFSRELATKHMLEVHREGKSLLASVDREKAEYYVTRLHGYGLQATMQRADAG